LGRKTDLRILADRTSLEFFGNGGVLYIPVEGAYPGDREPLGVTANGGTAKITTPKTRELKSAWK
jgi:hypothetical protein